MVFRQFLSSHTPWNVITRHNKKKVEEQILNLPTFKAENL
jgi:hypothetical protein